MNTALHANALKMRSFAFGKAWKTQKTHSSIGSPFSGQAHSSRDGSSQLSPLALTRNGLALLQDAFLIDQFGKP